jgi:hypothetical protein
MVSRTSVLGVPGYAAASITPASYAPLAIASLPLNIFFMSAPRALIKKAMEPMPMAFYFLS